MPDTEIISEIPMPLVEVKRKLEEVKKRDEELSFRGKKTEEYLKSIKTKDKKVEDIKKELETLDIIRLKPRTIIKIIDLLPQDADSLKLILSGENITLKKEDIDKIIAAVKKHA